MNKTLKLVLPFLELHWRVQQINIVLKNLISHKIFMFLITKAKTHLTKTKIQAIPII